MDHKVSKDMISSGMIPSGEKTQADLGRIQYGSNPSPSSLADAYKSMYEKKEEVINERLGLMKAAKLAENLFVHLFTFKTFTKGSLDFSFGCIFFDFKLIITCKCSCR